MRFRLAGLLAIALAGFALPASAAAATRYVATGGSDVTNDCTNPAAPCLTVQHAADAAVDGETVEIAAGTYEESVQVSGKALTFVGEGSGTLEDSTGATIVEAPEDSGAAAFELRRGGELRALRAVGGDGGTGSSFPFLPFPGGPAIALSPETGFDAELEVEEVVALGGPGPLGAGGGDGLGVVADADAADVTVEGSVLAGGSAISGAGSGVELRGDLATAELAESTLVGPTSGLSGTALRVEDGAEARVETSLIEGTQGAVAVAATLSLARSTVRGVSTALWALRDEEDGAEVQIRDSLVAGEGAGIRAGGEGEGTHTTASAEGTTIVAGGTAVEASESGEDNGSASVTLRNSIARSTSESTPVDLHADGGTIVADFSSFTAVVEENGGTASAAGSASNVSGDPLFVDPDEDDYRLQPSSPPIDAGDGSIVLPGQRDLPGAARSLDGDGDCVAAPDMGAHELTGHGAACTGTTHYVATDGTNSADCTDPEAPCLTVQHAADQAADGDAVEIDTGTYVESVLVAGKAVSFSGAGGGDLLDGEGGTVVRGHDGGPDVAGSPAFELPDGGALRSLRAEGGDGGPMTVPPAKPGGNAVVYQPDGTAATQLQLDSVVVLGGAGTFPALGGDGLRASGESATEPVDLAVEGSMLAGGFGLGSAPALRLNGGLVSAEVENSTLDATAPTLSPALSVLGGAAATVDGSRLEAEIGADVAGGSLILHRSVVEGGFTGVEAHQFIGQGGEVEVEDSLVTANGSAATVQTGGSGGPVTLAARGTTFAGGGVAALRVQQGGGGPAATATLRNSIARHRTEGQVDLLANGGTIEADFSSFNATQSENGGTAPSPGSASNVSGDPLFVDPDGGDFRLQPSSPLIDAGDPSIVEPGQFGLGGNARSLDGDEDCVAAPDIGAYELAGFEATCPTPGGDGDDETGDSRDSSGEPPPPPSPPPPPPTPIDLPPVVSAFKVTNKKFAPTGRRARSSAAIKRGTRFLYRLSEAARVVLVIKGGKRRVRLQRRQGAGRRSIPFSGRKRGKPLPPRRYVARIVAIDSAGKRSRPRRLVFYILRG